MCRVNLILEAIVPTQEQSCLTGWACWSCDCDKRTGRIDQVIRRGTATTSRKTFLNRVPVNLQTINHNALAEKELSQSLLSVLFNCIVSPSLIATLSNRINSTSLLAFLRLFRFLAGTTATLKLFFLGFNQWCRVVVELVRLRLRFRASDRLRI